MPAEESEMTTLTAARAGSPPDIVATAGLLLARLRQERLRVHAITNAAAQAFTANLLLAAGAIPSLTVAPDEVADFTRSAGALLVNLGTLDADRRAAIPRAIAAARASGIPWVLDPVFVDASPPRLALARLCLAGARRSCAATRPSSRACRCVRRRPRPCGISPSRTAPSWRSPARSTRSPTGCASAPSPTAIP
jgi:hypothetical protein